MKYAYYPGCSGKTTAAEYSESAIAICRVLGIELSELPDWNCCGASSAHSTNYSLSHALSGRNLAIAEKEEMDIAVTCPACFVRLKDTYSKVKSGEISKEILSQIIEKSYDARFGVRHLLEIITGITGLDMVRSLVKKPLTGLKAVAYYGCYLVRPAEITGFDDPENPATMDRLLGALGADVLDWRGKVDCCGGSLSLTDRNSVKKMTKSIAEAASEVNTDVIVTACGLCQSNLESRQDGENAIPALYFTELMGLAFGLDTKHWFKKHLIDPAGLLKKRGLSI